MRFKDKSAVITGGAGNLGLAAAKQLIAGGARVLLVDLDEPQLMRAAASLHSDGVATFPADVTSAQSVQAYAKRAAELYGKVDIFFNNAGIEGPNAPIGEFPEDAFDKVMAVNVKGVFLGMKYVPPHMNDGGSVIITSSIAGLMASGSFVAYTTSKHAVIGIMRDTACDLAPRGIRVNTVHPGFVKSEMLLRILRRQQPGVPDETLLEQFGKLTRLGRCITPDEIADMVAFLASDESRMATGQTFVVDAGTLL
jgi:NAD(P)-dependent dehydrogenase (short-subunit alcohol dehydrogenase family)